jgi:hypothetical protein
MARVRIEDILDDLSADLKYALEDAVKMTLGPGANFSRDTLFRNFRSAVRKKCKIWETVRDPLVEKR